MKTSPTHLPDVTESLTSYKTSKLSSTPSSGSMLPASKASTKMSLSNFKAYEASDETIKTNSPDSDQTISVASTSILLTNSLDSQS